jgi:hypothetical protein
MRELSNLLAALIVAVGVYWAAGHLAQRMRYSVAAAGETVVVVDARTGAVQTFARAPQSPHHFVYVATDSRTRARERREAAGAAAPADTD